MLVTDHPLATLIISRVVRWWSALLRNGHHGGERVVRSVETTNPKKEARAEERGDCWGELVVDGVLRVHAS